MARAVLTRDHAKDQVQSAPQDSKVDPVHLDPAADTQATFQQKERSKFVENGKILKENVRIKIIKNVLTNTLHSADTTKRENAKREINVTIFTR